MTIPAESLPCPMCDYDLRGQVEPRCPECGYRFDWDELRDPARRLHPYLFEHHPERNLWSFTRTLIGGLRPRRFWRTLLPAQPSRPGRLLIYAMVFLLATALPVAIGLAYQGDLIWQQMVAYRQSLVMGRILLRPTRTGLRPPTSLPSPTGWPTGLRPATQKEIDAMAPAPTLSAVVDATLQRGLRMPSLRAHLTLLLWPLASLAALMVFVFSLRRAHLRRVHLLRCVIYCGDIIIWGNVLLLFLLLFVLIGWQTKGLTALGMDGYTGAAFVVTCVMLLSFAYRLIIAVRSYLRFDHPIATVLATQIMVLLLLLIVLLNL